MRSPGPTPLSPRARSSRDLRAGREARDLPEGVDAGVGAAGDRQVDRLAQDRLQRRLELPLDGPQPGLAGPAREAGSVVFDLEADAGHGRSMPLAGPA